MANASYCISTGSNPSLFTARAQQLGCGVVVGDASGGLITSWPCVVVTSPVVQPVLIPDNTGQASIAAVQSALSAAVTAEGVKAATIADSDSQLQGVVAQLTPGLAQAQADLTALAASTDPLAPILARTIEGVLTIAQALGDTLVSTKLIAATDLPPTT